MVRTFLLYLLLIRFFIFELKNFNLYIVIVLMIYNDFYMIDYHLTFDNNNFKFFYKRRLGVFGCRVEAVVETVPAMTTPTVRRECCLVLRCRESESQRC